MTLPMGWNASPQAQDPADDVLPGAGTLPGPFATTDVTPVGGGRGLGNTDTSINSAGGTFNGVLQSALDAAVSYKNGLQVGGAVELGGYTATNDTVVGRGNG